MRSVVIANKLDGSKKWPLRDLEGTNTVNNKYGFAKLISAQYTAVPKSNRKFRRRSKENHQFQSKSGRAKMIVSKFINISECPKT